MISTDYVGNIDGYLGDILSSVIKEGKDSEISVEGTGSLQMRKEDAVGVSSDGKKENPESQAEVGNLRKVYSEEVTQPKKSSDEEIVMKVHRLISKLKARASAATMQGSPVGYGMPDMEGGTRKESSDHVHETTKIPENDSVDTACRMSDVSDSLQLRIAGLITTKQFLDAAMDGDFEMIDRTLTPTCMFSGGYLENIFGNALCFAAKKGLDAV